MTAAAAEAYFAATPDTVLQGRFDALEKAAKNFSPRRIRAGVSIIQIQPVNRKQNAVLYRSLTCCFGVIFVRCQWRGRKIETHVIVTALTASIADSAKPGHSALRAHSTVSQRNRARYDANVMR